MKVGLFVGDVIPGETLGVARYALGAAAGLAGVADVELSIIGIDAAVGSYQVVSPGSVTASIENLSSSLDVVVKIHQLQMEHFDVPTVTIFHDLHPLDVPWKYGAGLGALLEGIEQNAAEASAIVSEFPYTLTRVKQEFPSAADKLHLIPSPTLLDGKAEFLESAPFKGLPQQFILFPSQFQLHKNHWTLLSALRELRDEGSELELVLAGSSLRRYMRQRIEDRAHQLGLDSVVHFLGYVSEAQLVQLYRSCSVVVSPSLAEGGAYLAQEALLMAKPVSLSKLPSVEAHLGLMQHDVPLFDPSYPTSIALATSRAIDEHQADPLRAVSAAERVSGWTWTQVGLALKCVIDEVVSVGS